MINYELIMNAPVFKGFSLEELEKLLPLIQSRITSYKKGDIVFNQGDIISEIGIVLVGTLNGVGVDLMGHSNIVAHLSAPDIFGEAYANAKVPMMISIEALEDTQILFLDADKIRKVNDAKLNENILYLIANKNLMLSRKILMITPKAISERVMTYLSMVSSMKNSRSFDIPFDRQQLADYLLVDRSALSHTLSLLKKEGIIDYNKNHFILNIDND